MKSGRIFAICLIFAWGAGAAFFGSLERASGAEREPAAVFVDAAAKAGIVTPNVSGDPEQLPISDQNGQGAAFFDADGDGWLDVFLVGGSTIGRWRRGENPGNRLHRNKKDGTFEDVTAAAGVKGNAWGNGAAAADYDNDGDLDLFVTSLMGPDVMFRNEGDGRFKDATKELGVGGGDHWSSGAAFADFDADGWLDLYVSRYVKFDPDNVPAAEIKDGSPCLYKGAVTGCGPWDYPGDMDAMYRNEPAAGKGGGRKFADVTIKAGIGASADFRGIGAAAADFDGDGDEDVYVGCDVMPNIYFENLGNWRFRETSGALGLDLSGAGKSESGMGVSYGDVDGDGLLDIFTTNFAGEKNTLYLNEGGAFRDASEEAGIGRAHLNELGWGNGIADFNNDGSLDFFVSNGHIYPQVDSLNDPDESYAQPERLYLGDGRGRFKEANWPADAENYKAGSSRGAAFGDYDNDGDLDVLLVNQNAAPSLLQNQTVREMGAITILLVGTKSNRDAIGARVEATLQGRRVVRFLHPHQGYQSSHDPRIHIGLNGADGVESLRVFWPSGAESDFGPVKAGMYVLREGAAEMELAAQGDDSSGGPM